MKKINYFLFIFLVLFLISVASCQKQDNDQIKLDKDQKINEPTCSERNLNGKIIQFESKFCGHCATVKPILERLAQEKNIEIIFLDISKEEDRQIMESYKIEILFTPTLIANCNVVVGAKSKEFYENLLNEL